MIIAIDGPAASGKGTVARRLGAHFAYPVLDTGRLYRAVGFGVLSSGGDPADERAALAAVRDVSGVAPEAPELRSEAVGSAAAVVAAMPIVRQALLDLQRDFAASPPGGAAGAVLDGRDIGTVICPDADAKLFVTAAVEIRAARRCKQLRERGVEGIYVRVLADLQERDARDLSRSSAPLVPAEDALIVDTSAMDAETVFAAALVFVETQAAKNTLHLTGASLRFS